MTKVIATGDISTGADAVSSLPRAAPAGESGAHGHHTAPSGRRPLPGLDTAIRAEHLTCRYGGFTAVDDLSFEVPEGELFALLGTNGAGKTTTVEALHGARRADGAASASSASTRVGTAAAWPPKSPSSARTRASPPI
ncbi:hypothetical protein GCM10029992_22690 [Glycomyces albus]